MSTACVSMVMKSTGLGARSATKTKVPEVSTLTATRVFATCRERTSRRSRSCRWPLSTRSVPSGRGLRSWTAQRLIELGLVDQRPLEQLAAEDGVGEDAGRVAGLGDAAAATKWTSIWRFGHSMCSVPERLALPSICRISTTLKVSSVPCISGRSVYSPAMNVDLHTHTYPASSCSHITLP